MRRSSPSKAVSRELPRLLTVGEVADLLRTTTGAVHIGAARVIAPVTSSNGSATTVSDRRAMGDERAIIEERERRVGPPLPEHVVDRLAELWCEALLANLLRHPLHFR